MSIGATVMVELPEGMHTLPLSPSRGGDIVPEDAERHGTQDNASERGEDSRPPVLHPTRPVEGAVRVLRLVLDRRLASYPFMPQRFTRPVEREEVHPAG